MRVAVLGSGEVGRALGSAFAEHGHEVTIGSKTPDKPELLEWRRATGRNASTASFADAAAWGELVVLACLGGAVDPVLEQAGIEHFDGKVVIDVTNPLDFSHGFPPGLLFGLTDSLGERVQRQLPRARVVKAFNTVPNTLMGHPELPGGRPDMMIAGNDPAAKAEVARLLRTFGWPEAIDVGPIESARWLEALVPLWARVGAALETYQIAFKVVR